jgi:hypothetical protein
MLNITVSIPRIIVYVIFIVCFLILSDLSTFLPNALLKTMQIVIKIRKTVEAEQGDFLTFSFRVKENFICIHVFTICVTNLLSIYLLLIRTRCWILMFQANFSN